MSKAVQVRMGERTFLAETDNTVEMPTGLVVEATARQVSGLSPDERLPDGAQEVVSREEIEQKFADVKQVIISCCNSLHDAVASIPRPEKFAIEFGIKLAGEYGVPMLTKASGEANFKITVEWKKE